MHARIVPLASAALLLALAAPRSADACGGGVFYEQSSPAQVTGHRVVISMSSTQTVLWDQIQYQGAPESFAWVLPVKKGARLDVATDAWIETLDGGTTKVVSSPLVMCGGDDDSSGGCCFGGAAAGDGTRGFDDPTQGGVTVIHRETVGPYETETITTDMGGGALTTWLQSRGYAIPSDVSPILDDYVADGFDFIALRMAPGATVDQMRPVRVVSPGAGTTFPLRMLAAGTKDKVDLILYVIAEGRMKSGNITTVDFPHDKLSYDFDAATSNYDAVRDEALAQSEGRVFLTTLARKGPLLAEYEQIGQGFDSYNLEVGPPASTIAEAYFRQGAINEENDSECAAVTSSAKSLANSGDKVVDVCPADGSPCGTAAAGEIDSRDFTCENLEDLGVALTGMHPKDVWVTRLEARLPRAALSEDLELVPASEEPVERYVTAENASNVPCDEESAAAPLWSSKSTGGRPPRGPVAVLALAAGLALAALRRLGGRPVVQPAGAR